MIYSIEQNRLISKLKSIYNDIGYKVQHEGLYEWKIEDWKQFSNESEQSSPEFYANGCKWNLLMYPGGSPSNNKEYVSLFLDRVDVDYDYSVHIPVRLVFYVRDYYDYSNIHYETLPIQYYYVNTGAWGHTLLIKISELNKYLNGYNKCVFGVFYSFYQYERGQFRTEMKNVLYDEKEKRSIVSKCFYEWKIDDWNELSECELSQAVLSGGHLWKIELHREGGPRAKKGYVSIFLKCLDPGTDVISVSQTLFIRNYDYPECCCYNCNNSFVKFHSESNIWGFQNFIEKTKLFSKNKKINKEIIENNKCVVGVYFEIYEVKNIINFNDDEIKDFKMDILERKLIELSEEMEKDLREKIEKEYKEKNENEVREKIERELKEKVERELREKIERELREKIERELKEKVERELREKVERELRESIERELRESIERELRETIERELRETIERELRETIERELRETIEREIKEKYELKEKIEKELREKIERENLNKVQPINYFPYQYYPPYYPPPPSFYSPPNGNPNSNVPLVYYNSPNISPNQNQGAVFPNPYSNPNPNVTSAPTSTNPVVPSTPTSLSPNQSAVLVNNTQPTSPNQNALFVNNTPPTSPFVNNTPPTSPNQNALFVNNTPTTSPFVNNTPPTSPNQNAVYFNPYFPYINTNQKNTSSVDKKN